MVFFQMLVRKYALQSAEKLYRILCFTHLLKVQYKQLRWCNMYDTSILGHSSGVVAVVAALKKIVCLTQNR